MAGSLKNGVTCQPSLSLACIMFVYRITSCSQVTVFFFFLLFPHCYLPYITLIYRFPHKPWCLQYISFENTAGKGEIAHIEQFLPFPQCFVPVWRTFCHFHQIQNCRLQILSVRKSLKFVVWERVKYFEYILTCCLQML